MDKYIAGVVMRKIPILLFFFLSIVQGTAFGMAQQVDIRPEDLVGKTLIETWRRGSIVGALYRTDILTSKTMLWSSLTGRTKGNVEEVEYACIKVGCEILQMSWREKTTGSRAIITYNFKTMKMYGVIVEEDRDYLLKGSFTIERTRDVKKDRKDLPKLFKGKTRDE